MTTTVVDRDTASGPVHCIDMGVYLTDYLVFAALCDGGIAEGEPMAREFTKLWAELFTERRFFELGLLDKCVLLQLMGPSECNRAGLVRLSVRRWRAWLASAAEDDVKAALNRLERAELVFTDPDTEEVLFRPYMFYDKTFKEPWPMVNAFREMAMVRSPKVASMLLEELDRFDITRPEGTGPKSAKVRADLEAAEREAHAHLNSLIDGAAISWEPPFPEVVEASEPVVAEGDTGAAAVPAPPATRRGEPFSEPFNEGFAPRHAEVTDTTYVPGEMAGEPFSEGFSEGFEPQGLRHAVGEPFGEPTGKGHGVLLNSPVSSGEIKRNHWRRPPHLRVATSDTSSPPGSSPDHPGRPDHRCAADLDVPAPESDPPMPGRDQSRQVLASINDRVAKKRAAPPVVGNRAERRRRKR